MLLPSTSKDAVERRLFLITADAGALIRADSGASEVCALTPHLVIIFPLIVETPLGNTQTPVPIVLPLLIVNPIIVYGSPSRRHNFNSNA